MAGDSTSTNRQRTVWENPRTASGYMRLMEVVCPGTEGDVRVEGISENQYRQINECPMSDVSRSWAAFANNRILGQEFKMAEVVSKTNDTNGIKASVGETTKTLIPHIEA